MNPVQKAIWFVESHRRGPISLDDVARACHVSAFHVTRAFAATTGRSLMRYVRGRRLTEAARALAAGARDIHALAMEAGYGSHEAFTRAFRDHFGLTPEQVRAQGSLENLLLTESLPMHDTATPTLEPPRLVSEDARHFVGISARYNCEAANGIPDQWQKFGPQMFRIPSLGRSAYGICTNFDGDGNFDYVCAVEVTSELKTPSGLVRLEVPPLSFAVFHHRGHIAGIRGTMSAIFSQAIPEFGLKLLDGPTIERYGPEFNPTTGLGGLEIWVPAEKTA